MSEEKKTGRWQVWLSIVVVAAVTFAATLAMSGCNTAKGVGKDVEHAGEAIQDAAD